MPGPPQAIDLHPLSAGERVAAQQSALAALGEGGVVVVPGDTGYLVCARAGSAAGGGVARLARGGASADGPRAGVWVAPGAEAIVDEAPGLTLIGRKIVRTLAPGPVVFLVGMEEAALAAARSRLGVEPGVADDGRALHVRAPGPSVAATLAERSSGALCAWEPMDKQGRALKEAGAAADAAARLGVVASVVLSDSEPTGGGTRGRPTVVALDRAGGVRVVAEGSYEARYVTKLARLDVLFVCTGNTCRSPMAEAIAAGLAGKGVPLHFASAGVGAAAGSARTPEGAEAVKRLGYTPIRGVSRPLTRRLIDEADLIFAMTRGHLHAVLALDPGAADKAFVLDPTGEDVLDPIGLPQRAYDDTAKRLEGLIRERLKEWRSPP